MANFILSELADLDFEEIAIYSEINFGKTIADNYLNSLEMCFENVANNPLLYPIAETKNGIFRKCVYKSHAIYYTIKGDNVLIVRIIGAQDF